MDKDEVIRNMWRIFAAGLDGIYGRSIPLSLDWSAIGYIQGIRDGCGWQAEVMELSYWMIDFSAHKISLEG